MNALIDNASQDPRNLAAQLGILAAQNASPAPQSRLSAILRHLHDRNEERQQEQDRFRAAHFILAD